MCFQLILADNSEAATTPSVHADIEKPSRYMVARMDPNMVIEAGLTSEQGIKGGALLEDRPASAT